MAMTMRVDLTKLHTTFRLPVGSFFRKVLTSSASLQHLKLDSKLQTASLRRRLFILSMGASPFLPISPFSLFSLPFPRSYTAAKRPFIIILSKSLRERYYPTQLSQDESATKTFVHFKCNLSLFSDDHSLESTSLYNGS